MGLSVVTYALSKKYTDATAVGMGGLKGAPCTIQSIVKSNGQNIITFEWEDKNGVTYTDTMTVSDGTPIYTWQSGHSYNSQDLVVYNNSLYYCITPNSDVVFDKTKWSLISGGGSGSSIQVTVLPTPGPDEVNNIYQYIGATDANYKNGYFYKCVLDGSSYKWENIQVQDGSGLISINSMLLANNWDLNNQQTLTFVGYNSSLDGVIGVPSTATEEQTAAYVEAKIDVVGQSGDQFTFECEEVPEIDLPVTLLITSGSGGSGGGSAVLTDDLTATKTVGGVTVGDNYVSGTPLEDIIRDILAPVLYPTFTNPSASISATGAKLLETGATLATTITTTFNRGTINPAYGTSGKRSGPATEYALNGGTAQGTGTFNVTVTSAQLTYQVAVSYAAGEQPKDSAGRDYSTPLPAGSVNSNTITYEFVDALYANTSSAATMTKQALVSKGAGSKQLSLVATTAANPEQIDVPGSWTVSKIEVLNTLSGKWEDATSQFTKTTTSHDDAAGNPVSYNRYTCNLGMALGARDVKITWS